MARVKNVQPSPRHVASRLETGRRGRAALRMGKHPNGAAHLERDGHPDLRPIGSSTRCATAAFRRQPYRFPNSLPASRRAGIGCAGLSGTPRPSPGAPAPTSWSRSAETPSAARSPTPCSGTASAGGLLNGHRRRRPLTYANLRYPESRSESLRFPWPTGRSRSWISAGGWVASTAVNGSRILYVCRACRGTTHALPGSRRTIWPSLCSSARPEIT